MNASFQEKPITIKNQGFFSHYNKAIVEMKKNIICPSFSICPTFFLITMQKPSLNKLIALEIMSCGKASHSATIYSFRSSRVVM